MIYIHSLTLPSKLQADSFAEFAKTRYLPSLNGSAEPGDRVRFSLLRQTGSASDPGNSAGREFLVLADGPSASAELRVTGDAALERLFAAYSPLVRSLGAFVSIA